MKLYLQKTLIIFILAFIFSYNHGHSNFALAKGGGNSGGGNSGGGNLVAEEILAEEILAAEILAEEILAGEILAEEILAVATFSEKIMMMEGIIFLV